MPLFISVTEAQGAGEQLQSYRGASCEKTVRVLLCPSPPPLLQRPDLWRSELHLHVQRSWFSPASCSPVGLKHWIQIWLTPTHVYSIILYQSTGCSWTILDLFSFLLFVSQGSIYSFPRACRGLAALRPQPHYTTTVCLQRGVRYSDGLAGRVFISLRWRSSGEPHKSTHTHTQLKHTANTHS